MTYKFAVIPSQRVIGAGTKVDRSDHPRHRRSGRWAVSENGEGEQTGQANERRNRGKRSVSRKRAHAGQVGGQGHGSEQGRRR